jgi:hypothetical protein
MASVPLAVLVLGFGDRVPVTLRVVRAREEAIARHELAKRLAA